MALLGVRNAKYAKVPEELDIKIGDSMSNIDSASQLHSKRHKYGSRQDNVLEYNSSVGDDPASTEVGTRANVKNLAAYTKSLEQTKNNSKATSKNATRLGGGAFASSMHSQSMA